ncbi:MAG: acetate--CoA ligase family protein [Candidatus Methanofastidiosia archaeon]
MEYEKEKIDAIFNPRSVALIGASDKKGKMGHTFMKNLTSGYEGKIYPINPPNGEIMGHKCYKSVLDVPEPIDLAVFVIPARLCPNAMAECAKKGVKAAVVITSGFREAGEEGKKLEAELVKAANGIKIIGPNCFGIYNCNIGLNASMALGTPERGGDVSFLTQSGAYGMAIYTCSMDFGMKFAKIVAHGNKAGIEDWELVRYFGEDPETRVISMFLESVNLGKEFFKEIKKFSLKKPIVATKTGRTQGAARAAASHTAALAGSFIAYETAFKQSGTIFAKNGLELIDIVKGIDWQPLPRGPRIGIVTNSGGTAVELTDLSEEMGLKVPELSKDTQLAIKEKIPSYASAKNPIDMTPIWKKFAELYPLCIDALFKSPDVDIIMPILLQRSALMKDVVEVVRDCIIENQEKNKIKKPVYVCWVTARKGLNNMEILEKANIPCYEWPYRTARTASLIYSYVDFLKRRNISIDSIDKKGMM